MPTTKCLESSLPGHLQKRFCGGRLGKLLPAVSNEQDVGRFGGKLARETSVGSKKGFKETQDRETYHRVQTQLRWWHRETETLCAENRQGEAGFCTTGRAQEEKVRGAGLLGLGTHRSVFSQLPSFESLGPRNPRRRHISNL